MSASTQVMVQWSALHAGNHHGHSQNALALHARKRSVAALHARKQSVAISKQILLHELAPPSLSEIVWLVVLFFWAVFCCPVTRVAFQIIGWALDELVPEASDIALSTDL
ncbi:hypothetical protein PG985_009309 [Apiospora marii]|uniref:Uncharacterized protein n=1 Tax=Apiospora marii TaxID=335849 RepID=A0ABR1RB02_9PEZI